MIKQLNLILTLHFLTLHIEYGRMLDVLGYGKYPNTYIQVYADR
jgi:hypothetical protein